MAKDGLATDDSRGHLRWIVADLFLIPYAGTRSEFEQRGEVGGTTTAINNAHSS
jgi:hypothetical protein